MTYFTESALAANIITPDEADAIETWIDEVVRSDNLIRTFTLVPPKHLKAVFNRVCYFRSGISLQ